MRTLVVLGFLISTIIVCVLSETDYVPGQTSDTSAVTVTSGQALHRSKRSPYDPIVPALLLGKSFLLGAFLGKNLKRGWGWRPRPRGWGWKPVVVHHHSHGGWGGWEEPVVHHSSGHGGGWGSEW